MIDKEFQNKQDRLFGVYYWSGVAGWILSISAIFAASLIPPYDTNPYESYSPILEWTGIGILIFTSSYRYFLKRKMQARFWNEYLKIVNGSRVDIYKNYHPVLAGPVVQDNSYSLTLQSSITGNYKNYPTVLQDTLASYQKNTPGKDDATFSLRYIIQAVALPSTVPHIFIASKQLGKKRLVTPGNLWSLVDKLDQAQKLPDLEGDFGKYFDVYTSHQADDGLKYKKEIDALRVLTPDVMITLRDNGFNFHYELYGKYLYIIHEPDLLTAAELESFIISIDAALSELLPQLTNHDFTDDGKQLTIRRSAMTMDILLGPFVKPAKLALIYISIVFLGAVIGSSLQ